MFQLFIKLLTAGSGLSSKRFISIYSVFILTVVIFSDIYTKFDVPNIVYYSLITLATGSSVMTLIQNK